MVMKNHPAFFIFPRWIEVANPLRIGAEFNYQRRYFRSRQYGGKSILSYEKPAACNINHIDSRASGLGLTSCFPIVLSFSYRLPV